MAHWSGCSPLLPISARANFELGTLYFRLGSYDNAVHYFKAAAAAQDLDPQLRARLTAYLPEAEKQLSPVRWSGFLQSGLGYQTNVAALPDSGFVSIFGQNAPQGSGVTQKSDGEGFGLAKISNVYDFENQRGDTDRNQFHRLWHGPIFAASIRSRLYGSEHRAAAGARSGQLAGRDDQALCDRQRLLDRGHVLSEFRRRGRFAWLRHGAGLVVSPDFEWRHISVNNPGVTQITALGTGDYLSFSVAGTYRFTDFISLQVRPIYSRSNAAFNAWQSFNQGGAKRG